MPETLGQQGVETGLKVARFTLEDLGVMLRRRRADDTVTKAIARILRADLVVVNVMGLLPVAISSDQHPSGFDELMPKTLATSTAPVDRLHHAHVCVTDATPTG